MIQDAWWLVRKELRSQPFAVLFTLLSTALFAMMTAYFFKHVIIEAKEDFGAHYLLDAVFLLIVPNFVTIYLAGYYLDFRATREDPLRKLMLFYRSCPIPLQTISFSRSLKMLFLFTLQSILFFAIFIALLNQFGMPATIYHDLSLFILFWLGCGLALGSSVPFIEYGLSIRTVFYVCFIWVCLFFIVHVTLKIIFKMGVVGLVWQALQQFGLPLTLVSLLLGLLSCYFWNRRLHARLQTSDYL